MQKRGVVPDFLFPSDQDATTAVHPTMASSTTQRLAGLSGSRLLSSPRERICGVMPQKMIAQRSHFASYPLSRQRCTSTAVSGRSTGMLSIVVSTKVMSFSFAAPTASPTGIPLVSVSKLLLTPLLPRSVGFGPLFFPSQGGFCHSPVHGQPRPIDAFGLVVFEKPLLPKAMKESLFRPVLKTPMSSTARTNTRSIQSIPLAACMQHKKNGVENNTVLFRLSASLSRMRILSERNPRRNLFPKCIRDRVALLGHGLPSHGKVSPFAITTSTV